MARNLSEIAYVRSGDKGDVCTAGLIAKTPHDYAQLLRSVSPERVRALYGSWIKGGVECYPMDNIQAVVVVMRQALGGGATQSLRLDQTGKSLGAALLRLSLVES
jgi:hypothetical protein